MARLTWDETSITDEIVAAKGYCSERCGFFKRGTCTLFDVPLSIRIAVNSGDNYYRLRKCRVIKKR